MKPGSVHMSEQYAADLYPRKLREKELDLIEFVLPADRPGYRQYREWISSMVVLGEGRRGRGNFILGFEGDIADVTSPLSSVIAYGMVETTLDKFSITVREHVGRQIDAEIVSARGEEIPAHFEEKRRWTYSLWLPGEPSPVTGLPVHQVTIEGDLVLAIAKQEKRIWVYDRKSGMNLLIPITNFYNELMLHKSIRDPRVALKSDLFFQSLETYTDAEIRASFIAYNKLKRKVELKGPPTIEEQHGLKEFLMKLLRKRE
jgi:hypothetical protein